MTATADNRKYSGDGSGLGRGECANSYSGPIAADEVLFTGALGGQLYADTARNPAIYDYVADGTMRCIGFVTLGADNTDGALGARPCRVEAIVGLLVDANAGGGSAISAADKFSPIYGVDNQTCSKLSSAGPCIGVLVGIDGATGKPMVLVDPVMAVAFDSLRATDLVFDASSELTIAAGAITITQSYHTVDTESDAASDDLDTINGVAVGQLVVLFPASAARTVVLKHNTGNIFNPQGKDISLAESTDGVALFRHGTKLIPLGRSVLAAAGGAYTQTYATADRTIANPTATAPTALTDNSGGAAADGTIGAITVPAALTVTDGAGTNDGTIGAITDNASTIAAVQELAAFGASLRTAIIACQDAIKELATKSNTHTTAITALVADDLDVRQGLTAVIDDLQAAGVAT